MRARYYKYTPLGFLLIAAIVSSIFATAYSQGKLTIGTIQAQTTILEWPMPGYNAQRTSWVNNGSITNPSTPAWSRNFEGFIPSKAHLVTKAGEGTIPDLIFVPTSQGLHAIKATDGSDFWFYPTDMPIGNSPTVHNGIVYVGVFDKTIHAINITTGQRVWQTKQAGAGYVTNPLVANNLVYAGNRDGTMYAFKTTDGSLAWRYQTAGSINYSAAINQDGTTLYFASNDSHAYALRATDQNGDGLGDLIWKSQKLPGDGFYSYWPVVFSSYVLFPGSNNYPPPGQGDTLTVHDSRGVFPDGTTANGLVGPVDSAGWIDAQRVIDYFTANPTHRTLFVLNQSNGQEPFYAPILYNGNASGNRYPPVVGPQGYVYSMNMWIYGGTWLSGRVSAWQIGTTKIKEASVGTDSADENAAISIIGDKLLYVHKDVQDGRFSTLFDTRSTRLWSAWGPTLGELFPGYDAGWELRKYGHYYPSTVSHGTHGNVSPLVPIRDKVCFHALNAVMCFKER